MRAVLCARVCIRVFVYERVTVIVYVHSCLRDDENYTH